MAFVCGSFNHQEEDDFEVLWPSTPPRKTTRRHSFCCRSNKSDKNPYASRGLDKFEALLANIDNKKQKIFMQKGSEDISFVRFVFSNSDDVKPIIVKLKDHHKKQDKDKDQQKQLKHENAKTLSLPKVQSPPLDHQQNTQSPKAEEKAQAVKPLIKVCERGDWSVKRVLEEWWKPSYYLPLLVIFILVLLTFFGRSFAIVCTSLCWYFVPMINESLDNSKMKSKKIPKKEFSRKFSEKKMISSPRSFLSGPLNDDQRPRKSF